MHAQPLSDPVDIKIANLINVYTDNKINFYKGIISTVLLL